MAEERDVQELYDRLMEYEKGQHEQSQKKIKTGIILLWIIPLVFLALMFITNSSKPIFLVLWIVSLFAIAIYLILVEYNDYKLQEKMNEINGREEKIESLMDVDAVEERVIAVSEKIEERVETREKEKQERREEMKELATEKAAAVVARRAKRKGGDKTDAQDTKGAEETASDETEEGGEA